MKELTITEFKKLKVGEIKASLPIRLMVDGQGIAVVSAGPGIPPSPDMVERTLPKQRTQCPNCKMEYDVTPPDGKPPFFTCKHPK